MIDSLDGNLSAGNCADGFDSYIKGLSVTWITYASFIIATTSSERQLTSTLISSQSRIDSGFSQRSKHGTGRYVLSGNSDLVLERLLRFPSLAQQHFSALADSP